MRDDETFINATPEQREALLARDILIAMNHSVICQTEADARMMVERAYWQAKKLLEKAN
jgi:hypothetical protein